MKILYAKLFIILWQLTELWSATTQHAQYHIFSTVQRCVSLHTSACHIWVAYRVREAVLTAVVLQSQSNNFHCGQNTFHRGQNTFHCGQDRFHCSQFSIAVRVVLTAMKNEFDRGEKWSNHRQAYKGVKSCFKCSYRNFWPRSNLL